MLGIDLFGDGGSIVTPGQRQPPEMTFRQWISLSQLAAEHSPTVGHPQLDMQMATLLQLSALCVIVH
jgi:hypothetical protein